METLLTISICYLGFGALTCAGPRHIEPGFDEHSPLGQWRIFRETWFSVVTWPIALWREFGPTGEG